MALLQARAESGKSKSALRAPASVFAMLMMPPGVTCSSVARLRMRSNWRNSMMLEIIARLRLRRICGMVGAWISIDLAGLERAPGFLYPGRLAMLAFWESNRLTTTPLRETLNRQTGMYRAAAKISDEAIDQLVSSFCRSRGGPTRLSP